MANKLNKIQNLVWAVLNFDGSKTQQSLETELNT